MSYEGINDNQVIKKCRKEHRCGWCSEKILKGEPAIKRVYKWEGDFNSEYMHIECHMAMKKSPEANEGYYDEQERGKTIKETEARKCST